MAQEIAVGGFGGCLLLGCWVCRKLPEVIHAQREKQQPEGGLPLGAFMSEALLR